MALQAGWRDYLDPIEGFIPLVGQDQVFRLFSITDDMTHLVVQPTGYGKTISAIGAYGILRGRHLVDRLLILVPSETLRKSYLRDIEKNFTRLGLTCKKVLKAEKIDVTLRYHEDNDAEVFITSYQSLIANNGERWFARLLRTGLWMIAHDEAHHLGDEGEWAKKSQIVASIATAKLYLSATPLRTDGRPLLGVPRMRFTDGTETYRASVEITLREAVEEGAIREPQGHISHYWISVLMDGSDVPQRIDTESLRRDRVKNFNKYEARRQMRYEHSFLSRILLDTIACLQHKLLREPGEHQAMVFAMTCTHAEDVCAQLNHLEPGIADWIGITRSEAENDAVLEAFLSNKLPILVQVDKAGEGFDNPRLSVLTFIHLINSPSKLLQQIGRGLRINRNLPHDAICDIFAPSDTDIAALVHKLESEISTYRAASFQQGDSDMNGQRHPEGYHPFEIPDFSVVDSEFIRTDLVNRRIPPDRQKRLEELKKYMTMRGMSVPSDPRDLEKLLSVFECMTSGGGQMPDQEFNNESERRDYWGQRVDRAVKLYVSNLVRWRALYRDVGRDEQGQLIRAVHNRWIAEQGLSTNQMKSHELEEKYRWLQRLNGEWIENRQEPPWMTT